MKHIYNWVKDSKDERDFNYQNRFGSGVVRPLPAKIDLTNNCSPVEDQEQIGSCTANALVGNMEYLEHQRSPNSVTDLSRLFIYYNERVFEGTQAADRGATLRDGIKALQKLGVCDESLWPYKNELVRERPNDACFAQAMSRRISSYESLKGIHQMKDCLATGFPFVFGFQVYERFESAEVAKTGTVDLPSNEEELLGGHAVMAVGYDDGLGRFIVRNSWGVKWGRGGYFTMPYAYLDNAHLSSDFWTIKG